MNKKVRYAVGAIGAVPTLGLIMPATAAAATPAHAPKKTVRIATHRGQAVSVSATGTCTANKGHTASSSGVAIKFYSKPVGSHTCIGTVDVNAGNVVGIVLSVGMSVVNKYGSFCQYHQKSTKATFGCHHVFRRANLSVVGNAIGIANPIGFWSVRDRYPF